MSLKPQPAKKVIKALSKIGFKIVRKHGSHVVLKHSDGRITVVPVHAGEEIGSGLLSKIIKDTGLSKEEFLKLLKN
ncbi:MAG: type II toxin-antitoxin system HicA family toxin [Candidatus Bathyarchaeia archaeon]